MGREDWKEPPVLGPVIEVSEEIRGFRRNRKGPLWGISERDHRGGWRTRFFLHDSKTKGIGDGNPLAGIQVPMILRKLAEFLGASDWRDPLRKAGCACQRANSEEGE